MELNQHRLQPRIPSGSVTALLSSSPPLLPPPRKRSLASSQICISEESASTEASGLSPQPQQQSRRKQHKVSRACDLCRVKKARCSGTLPCASCSAKGVECVYHAKYSRGRPPTPPPADAAVVTPRSIPVASGATGSLCGMKPRTPLSARAWKHSSHGQPDGDYQGKSRSVSVMRPDGDAPSRASPEVDMAEIEGQYFDPTSALTFLHRAYKRLSSQKREIARHSPSGAENRQPLMTAVDRPFMDIGGAKVPGRDAAVETVAFYFDVCVVTYIIFHRPSVTAWLETMLSNAEQDIPLHHGIGHAKASIVLTILAIATLRKERLSGNLPPEFAEASSLERSDQYFVVSKELTDAETGLPRLESAQARLIQVLYLLQTSRMNQAWYVFGTTSQIIQALGLHRRAGRKRQNSSRPARSDYINAQCRKRTFWTAYTIDKYLSVVLGRPMQHRDEDIDQDFPDCVNDEDMTLQGPSILEPLDDCRIDALIFHAKVAQIISNISREVYTIKHIATHERIAAARQAGRQLHQWRESLPTHLGTVRPSSLIPSFRRQATALKLAYSHAIMHANRPFLLGHMASSSSGLEGEREVAAIRDSVTECITAAEVALETVDGMARDGTLFHAFWWTSYVTFCALAVVYVWKIQRGSGTFSDVYQRDSVGDGNDNNSKLEELAERCRSRLDRGTPAASPNRSYSVVLEELRMEAKRQFSSTNLRNHELDQPGPASRAVAEGDLLSAFGHANVGDVVQHEQTSAFSAASDTALGQEGFPTPGDGGGELYGVQNLLDRWQTTDWLDLDSSVCLSRSRHNDIIAGEKLTQRQAFGLFAQTDEYPDFWDVN